MTLSSGLVPGRLGVGRSRCGCGAAGRRKPAALGHDGVQHLQDALQLLALDHASGAISALTAQLEAKRILFARNRQALRKLGAGGA